MNIKLLVVGFLAVVLIGLYIFSMMAVLRLNKNVDPDGVAWLFSSIGGLVTAFAIGFLAVSQPGEIATSGLASGMSLTNPTEKIGRRIEKTIPVAFVLAWLICGALSVYFGLISGGDFPDSMAEMGKGWIGTVIAAVGALFGVNPKKT